MNGLRSALERFMRVSRASGDKNRLGFRVEGQQLKAFRMLIEGFRCEAHWC